MTTGASPIEDFDIYGTDNWHALFHRGPAEQGSIGHVSAQLGSTLDMSGIRRKRKFVAASVTQHRAMKLATSCPVVAVISKTSRLLLKVTWVIPIVPRNQRTFRDRVSSFIFNTTTTRQQGVSLTCALHWAISNPNSLSRAVADAIWIHDLPLYCP